MPEALPEYTSLTAPVPEALPVVEDVTPIYPPCTAEESDFALAIVEVGGNIAAAVKLIWPDTDARNRLGKGQIMLGRPQVALKIRELTGAIQEASLVSLGAHLQELALIRDLGKDTGQLKTALSAEVKRGEVAGLYAKHQAGANNGKGGGGVNIMIQAVSVHDASI